MRVPDWLVERRESAGVCCLFGSSPSSLASFNVDPTDDKIEEEGNISGTAIESLGNHPRYFG